VLFCPAGKSLKVKKMANIALIGLGAMGSAIARALLKNSGDLLVWNHSTNKRDLETGGYEAMVKGKAIGCND